jgi:hypothetical protein
MIMRDPMHQVDLGTIVHLIRAIMRKFQECVETVGKAGTRSSQASESLGADACQAKDLRNLVYFRCF